MINLTLRIDPDIKERAEKLFGEFGMTLITAVNVFIRQALRQGEIPFRIFDPFYSDKNQTELVRRAADVSARRNLSAHDLIDADAE
jgi:DNA-damage-inducible protein J